MVVWLSCKMLGSVRQGNGFFGKGSQKESFLEAEQVRSPRRTTRILIRPSFLSKVSHLVWSFSVLGSPQTSPRPRGPLLTPIL